MFKPLHQENVVNIFKGWMRQIPNPVIQRQLLATLELFEQVVWQPSILQARMNEFLPDVEVTKKGLNFTDPLPTDRVQIAFTTYLAAVESEGDLFTLEEAVRYISLKVQQTGKILSPLGVQHYIDQNKIKPVTVSKAYYFTRSALDEFVKHYVRATTNHRLDLPLGVKYGTEV